jgi:Uma2 family endonuclease
MIGRLRKRYPMADLASSPEPELRLSREDYRRWVDARPNGRFERIEGVVVAMAPERAGHNDTKALVWLALRQAVAAAGLPCHVYADGMTVEVEDSDFEPDAVLHCGEKLPRDAIAVPEPVVVVEVLSPSTRGDDLTRKLVAYFRLPSVQHYLVFWADRPQVVHHRRRDDGLGIETRILTEGVIRLDPPGILITLAEIYGG